MNSTIQYQNRAGSTTIEIPAISTLQRFEEQLIQKSVDGQYAAFIVIDHPVHGWLVLSPEQGLTEVHSVLLACEMQRKVSMDDSGRHALRYIPAYICVHAKTDSVRFDGDKRYEVISTRLWRLDGQPVNKSIKLTVNWAEDGSATAVIASPRAVEFFSNDVTLEQYLQATR